MSDTHSIRRRVDGSIDTQFYMAQGRVVRSQQARRVAGTQSTNLPKALVSCVAGLAVLMIVVGVVAGAV